MAESSCGCGSDDVRLLFSCSGAADVGALADQAARKLTKEGAGGMACLAGIGGGVSGMIESAKAASKVLVIDGCPVDCGKKSMEKAGVSNFDYIRVTDLGLIKGKSPVNDKNIETVAQKGREVLTKKSSCCG